MSAITTLRGAIGSVTIEVEDRIVGVINAAEGAVLAFVSAIFVAVEVSVHQVVETFFGLIQTVVDEGFNVVDAVVTAAFGAVEDDADIDAVTVNIIGTVPGKEEGN